MYKTLSPALPLLIKLRHRWIKEKYVNMIVLISVLQRNRTTRRHRSAMIFRLQAGDSGRLEVYFQSESTGLRIRNNNGISSSSRAGEDWCPSSNLQAERERERERETNNSTFLGIFVLFRPSVGWMRPTHNREGNLLYSAHQFNC